MTEETSLGKPPDKPAVNDKSENTNMESPAPEDNNSSKTNKNQGKKRKSFDIPAELMEPKRERRSRGAKTKAELGISLACMKESDPHYAEISESVGRGRGSQSATPKKQKWPTEVLSSSPLKFKAGPKCSKKPLKPGPKSKRLRNFQLEDLYLDIPSVDERPLKAKYEKELAVSRYGGERKEKLKCIVPLLDISKVQKNPSTKAAFDLAQEHWVTVGQFQKDNDNKKQNSNSKQKQQDTNNVVTVTYQRPPKTLNTFQHKPDPTRVVVNDAAAKIALPKVPLPSKKSTIPDPLKPPPITNYMSVKIEILMNCLEKMYHNHLPLNAFTSRFPNARAKAMLTLMLDGHRQECDSCDKILDDANVGIFHGDEQKLKMDLAAFGPAIPTQAPVVDLSQYPDNIAEMKKLLVEKDAKIKALEARLQSLNKETKTDAADRLDLVQMLDGVNEPTMDKYGGKFLKTAGYRLVDLRLLRMALEICQTCHHGKMTLAEMSPDVDGNQEDLVTRLAFVCTVCGPKAIFPTSPFSKNYPSNYSLNKLLLPLLGPSAYFHLSEFLQHNPDTPQEITTSAMFNNQKPQLLVSVDHAFFDFARPFDPPMPDDPDANIISGGSTEVSAGNSNSNSSSQQLKVKSAIDLKISATPAQINLPPLRPLEGVVAETNGKAGNGSSSSNGDAAMNDSLVISRKVKNCPELPSGCKIMAVAAGTKLVSKNVKYSTTRKTGLSAGCYRVKEKDKLQERIVIVRDENSIEQDNILVTNLERDHKQIEVGNPSGSPLRMILPNIGGAGSGVIEVPEPPGSASAADANNSSSKPKKSSRKNDDSGEEEGEKNYSDDDSDDPSWGNRRRKSKNDVKNNKKGGRRKNPFPRKL